VCHDSFICVTWLIHICDMTHSYVQHDSFICVTWLIHMCAMTHSYVWHDLFTCTAWLIHMCNVTYSHVCDVTHSYVRHDSFISATLLLHMCNVIHSHVQHDTSTCETWCIHMCGMTHPSVRHDSFMYTKFSSDSFIHNKFWLIHDSSMTNACVPNSGKQMSQFSKKIDSNFDSSMTHSCLIHVYEWLIHTYQIWSIYTWDTTHPYARNYSFVRETGLIYVCDMTYSYVRHGEIVWMRFSGTDLFICAELLIPWDSTHLRVRVDLFVCETWSIRVNRILIGLFICAEEHIHSVRQHSSTRASWLIHMWDMKHSCGSDFQGLTYSSELLIRSWDSTHLSTCANWLIHMWDIKHSCESDFQGLTYSYARNYSFREAALIYVCDLTYLYVRHQAFVWIGFSGTNLFICAEELIHPWDSTHLRVRVHSFICETWSIRVNRIFIWLIHMYQILTHSWLICVYGIFMWLLHGSFVYTRVSRLDMGVWYESLFDAAFLSLSRIFECQRCIKIHKYIYIYTYKYIYIYTYKYIYTYTHIYGMPKMHQK